MLKVSASKVAHLPPGTVWEVLCDPSRYADLVAGTAEGTPSLGAVGAAFARLLRGPVARDSRRSLEDLAELAGR